jgi:signal transduction histidine kinase
MDQRVSYIGIGGREIELLERSKTLMVFSEVYPAASAAVVPDLDKSDVFLIGPYATDPLTQASRIANAYPLLSIVLLCFQEAFQKLKLEALFARATAKHLQIVSYEFGMDLTGVLTGAANKSMQRRSFQKVLAAPLPLFQHKANDRELGLFLVSVPFIVMVFDQAEKLIEYNSRATRSFGLSVKDLGESWSMIFGDTVDIFSASAHVEHMPIEILGRHFEATMSHILVSGDHPMKMVILCDTTEKIHAAAKLAEKMEELQFLNQELDEFVNVISHDFKTPLTAIIGLTGLLKRTEITQRQLELISRTEASANQIKNLLEGLSKLVSIKENKDSKAQVVSFEESLDSVLQANAIDIEAIGATVRRDFHVQEVSYYPAHILSLMSNLITNAVKYRKEGVSLELSISTYQRSGLVVLEVSDNGIGMNLTRDRAKLFQPFQRLTHLSTGTGLGLSIIKKALERNRGHIEVSSLPGKGTTFQVFIRPVKY